MGGEQGGIQHDLVDRSADSTLGHDDGRRAEHRCDHGVRQADHGTDSGVACPLHEHDLTFRGKPLECRADASRQVLDDVAGDVRLGEAPRYVNRTHEGEWLGQVEDALHKDCVLIGRDAVLDDRSLADGLDESRRQAAREEAVHQPDRDRRLSAVLAGRREIQMTHRCHRADVWLSRI